MSEREPDYYPSPYLSDHSSLLFMSPDVDPFPVGGGQDAQEWSPSSLDNWELDVIPPSDLPAPTAVFGEPSDDDDTFPFNIMQNHSQGHIPSINIDPTVPLSHLNTHGLSSPISTTPHTAEPFPAPTHRRRMERSAHNRGALYVPGHHRLATRPELLEAPRQARESGEVQKGAGCSETAGKGATTQCWTVVDQKSKVRSCDR